MGFSLEDLKNIKKPEINDQQKKLVKIGIIAVGVIIALILIMTIVKAIVGTKISNEQLENVMVRAARLYVKDNPDKLTDDIFGEDSISISNLVAGGYMKEITKYKGKDTNCKGSVTVFKNADYYSYSPKLTCGADYTYKTLSDTIIDDKNIVTAGNGLYYNEVSNYYVFRGEYVNNYLTFAGQTWRILRVDEDGNIRLLQANGTQYIKWDDRYNSEINLRNGINYFEGTENSRIKDSILDYYNNEENFSSESKSVIIPKEFCVGSRSDTSNDRTGATECMTKSELMGAGLPYVSELLEISIDTNCSTVKSNACSNYNYIDVMNGQFWTGTPYSGDTYQVYYTNQGKFYKSFARELENMNIVITINGDINYTSGSGTENDPYVVKAIG